MVAHPVMQTGAGHGRAKSEPGRYSTGLFIPREGNMNTEESRIPANQPVLEINYYDLLAYKPK